MNKVVLITGSAIGIGRAIALEMASAGYNVVINYNTSKKEALELKKQIEALNVRCLAIKADVSKEDEVISMVKEIEENFNGVDVLVNNAAIDINEFFYKKNIDDFKKTFEVNVLGAYLVAKHTTKYMQNNKWGRVINISSTNGINTYYPVCMEYDASKAALISLTHNMAVEFSPYITVNAIAPGFIGTENELDGMDDEFIKSEEEKILVKRMGKPEDVAHLVKFLASDEASFINNSIIRIDGGQYGSN